MNDFETDFQHEKLVLLTCGSRNPKSTLTVLVTIVGMCNMRTFIRDNIVWFGFSATVSVHTNPNFNLI